MMKKLSIALLVIAIQSFAFSALADIARISSLGDSQHAKITFTWNAPVSVSANKTTNSLILTFNKNVEGDFTQISNNPMFGTVVPSLNGRTLTLPLRNQNVTIDYHNSDEQSVIYVDDNSATSIPTATANNTTPANNTSSAGNPAPNGFIEKDIFTKNPKKSTPIARAKTTTHTTPSKAPSKTTGIVKIPVYTGDHKTFYRIVFSSKYAVKYRIYKRNSYFGIQLFHRGILHYQDKALKSQGIRFHPVNNSKGLYTRINFPGKMRIKSYILQNSKLVIDLTKVNSPNNTSAPTTATTPKPTPTATPTTSTKAPTSSSNNSYKDYLKNQQAETPSPTKSPTTATATPTTPTTADAKSPTGSLQNSNLQMNLSNTNNPDVAKTDIGQTEKDLLKANSIEQTSEDYDFAAPKVKSDNANIKNPNLTFAWDISVASASFTRGDQLWIVFDHKLNNLDITKIQTATQGFVDGIKQIDTDDNNASAIILHMKEPLTAVPRNEGLSWIYTLKRGRILPKTDIPIDKKLDNARRVLLLPVASPSFPIQFTDPENKDNLVVVPLGQPGHGVKNSLSLPQLHLLSSSQGVAFVIKDDDLIIQSIDSGIEVKNKYNLFFTNKSAKLTQYQVTSRGDVLKLSTLAADRETMRKKRIAIEHEISQQTGLHRNIARMKLARFYIANGWFFEAETVLALIKEDDPEIVERINYRLATGIISLMRGDLPQAWEKLYAPQLSSYEEALLWRGIYLHKAGDDVAAKPILENYYALIQNYPKKLHYMLGKDVIDSAMNVEDYKIASGIVDDLMALNLSNYDEDTLFLLKAEILEKTSFDVDDPLEVYNKLIATADNPSVQVHAEYNRAKLLFEKDQMPIATYLKLLDKLSYKWRGDIFEYRVKENMAKLYLKNKMYRQSLLTLRDMINTFSNKYNVDGITKIMKTEFEDLFLHGKSNELEAVKALSLYNEFKELTPEGDKGEAMISQLVDRLVSVDLFDDATKLLTYQVKHRLEGNVKNKVAIRNAVVYLLKPNPTDALEALKSVDYKNITPAVALQATQLKAQALSQLDKTAKALDLIKEDDTVDGLRLRADLYWKQHNWPLASKAYSTLLPRLKIRPNSKLSDNQSAFLNNLATVLVLAGNTGGLDVLRVNYGASMANTKFKKSFALLTSSDTSPDNINDLSSELDNTDSYHNFMDSYSERISKNKLSSIN